MKLSLRIALIALLFASTLFVSFLGDASAKDIDYYRKHGVTITASRTWNPYSFVGADGKPAGFYIDYWSKWSEVTGIPVEFRLVTWSESISLVASGECDIQSGLYFTKERNQIFAFSQPVFHSKAVLVVSNRVGCDAELPNLKWGGVDGTVEKKFAEDYFAGAEAKAYKSSNDLFNGIASGEIQAAIDDWSTAISVGRELGISNTFSICETVYKNDLFAIVLKDRADLLKLINEGLSRITEDDRRFLINKWFIGQEDEANWKKFVVPVSSAALVILLGVYLSFRLSKRKN